MWHNYLGLEKILYQGQGTSVQGFRLSQRWLFQPHRSVNNYWEKWMFLERGEDKDFFIFEHEKFTTHVKE